MEKGDKIIVTFDYCYPKIVGKQGFVITKAKFIDGWYIVAIGSEIHACQEKHLRKLQ